MKKNMFWGYGRNIAAAVVILAGAWLGAAPAFGATILTTDDKSISGAIKDIESGTLVVQEKVDDPAVMKIPLADVSQITFTWQERVAATPSPSTAPASQPTTQPKSTTRWRVEFGEGDHVTAGLIGWTDAGVALTGETLGGGAFTIPVDQLRAIWSTSDSLVRKAKDVGVDAQGQDVVYVLVKENEASGASDAKAGAKDVVKAVTGLATGSDGEFLNFKYGGQDHGIKLEKIVGLVLAQREMPADKELYEVFTLSTGEVFSGRISGMDKIGFRMTTPSATTHGPDNGSLTVPISKIDKIAVRNGRLVRLGDLKPVAVIQTPYLDRLMPYRVNQSLTGGTLALSDGVLEYGIAVHAKCFLTYDIDGGFERFRVKVGFQQPEGKIGRAAIRLVGDEKVLWEDPDMKGDAKPAAVDVSVQGVKMLRLEVDYGKDQDVGDRVIWGDPRLVKTAAKN